MHFFSDQAESLVKSRSKNVAVYDFESVSVGFYERRVDDAVRKVNRLLELESVNVSGDVATLHDRLKRHIKAKLQCFTNSS